MLYMVECRFKDAAREEVWNDWYSNERLGELLSVPGFRASQRFKAVTRPATYYLAVHSIDSLRVFETPEYKAMGGGGFLGYQEHITDWKRRFFDEIDIAPAVSEDEYFVVTDATPEDLKESGITFTWLRPAAAKQGARRRGITVVRVRDATALALPGRFLLDLYTPIMSQRSGGARTPSVA